MVLRSLVISDRSSGSELQAKVHTFGLSKRETPKIRWLAVWGISQKLYAKEVNQGKRCSQKVQPGEEKDMMLHQKLQLVQGELGGGEVSPWG